ncbi:MAG TPA: hypothetical protein VER57_02280 [Cyanobium sp.]|nr:hypothetical protein [Cyanobium sp.]
MGSLRRCHGPAPEPDPTHHYVHAMASVQQWLEGGREVELIGYSSPWGPWLRVYRLER